eukprot:COSAG06_NODE_14020_length_1197_cov_1.494536_1_plen_133_part_01
MVVPDHIEDPQEVVHKMLAPEEEDGWGMPLPSMTIGSASSSGDYMNPVNAGGKSPASWQRFPPMWTEKKEMPENALKANQDEAKEQFATKMEDVMYGICRAAAESKGWLVSRLGCRAGGNLSGGIADEGVKKF